MNFFEKKLAHRDEINQPTEPIELYQSLFHDPDYGYLRGVQEEVLKKWHERRHEENIVFKMNTGSGKTLTGLLVLYSKLIETAGPSLYLCPDNQLVEQVFQQSKKYGIPTCVFNDNGNIPEGFLNEKSILICNFDKFFNGKSVFVKHNIFPGSVLLDDGHKCIDKSRRRTSLFFKSDSPIYRALLDKFAGSIKDQSKTRYYNINNGDPEAFCLVPYWTWIDNIDFVIQTLNDNSDDPELFFKWNLIQDVLTLYNCFFTGGSLEISPMHVPIESFSPWSQAKHKFILSATFSDDVALLTNLGYNIKSILSPIVPSNRKDIGQRLILSPKRFDSDLLPEKIRKFILTAFEPYNIAILTPSFKSAEVWEELGATVVEKESIVDEIEKLSNSNGNQLVFVNRYDGLDLKNDLCRVLVIDGIPKYNTLHEGFFAGIDNYFAGNKAQIIEQGLGRSVRSGSDFSVVFLIGGDLDVFIGFERNIERFTPVTISQLKLGLDLLEGEPNQDSLKLIKEVSYYCLKQDENWRKYHATSLSDIKPEIKSDNVKRKLSIASIEKKAFNEFWKRNYQVAKDIIENEIIKGVELTANELGWYYQLAGNLIYPQNKQEANDLQIIAADNSSKMHFPPMGRIYAKLNKNKNQAAFVCKFLTQFSLPSDVVLHFNQILQDLDFSTDISSERFECSVNTIGNCLGFTTQRPEKDTGAGPDNLWCLDDGHFFIIEAKSQSKSNTISKSDISQLLHSESWFKAMYGSQNYTSVIIHPSNKKERNVNPSDNTKVLDSQSLNLLKENIVLFAKSLQGKSPKSFSVIEIHKLLLSYNLNSQNIESTYLRKIK